MIKTVINSLKKYELMKFDLLNWPNFAHKCALLNLPYNTTEIKSNSNLNYILRKLNRVLSIIRKLFPYGIKSNLKNIENSKFLTIKTMPVGNKTSKKITCLNKTTESSISVRNRAVDVLWNRIRLSVVYDNKKDF